MAVVSERDAPHSSPSNASDQEWAALAQAATADALCQAWLGILCRMVRHTRGGLLLLEDADGVYAPAGLWPEGADLGHLAPVARESLGKHQGIVQRDGPGEACLAYPLMVADRLYGAVVLDLHGTDETAVTQATRLTHWGSGWLIDLFNRRELGRHQDRLEHTGFLFDAVLAALGEPAFRKATLNLVNELAQRFDCHQVLLGAEKGKRVEILAMSHAAWFDERTNLLRLAAAAMDEAFDQRARILWPEPDSGLPLATAAHGRYARDGGGAMICSQPLESAGRVTAVLMLERDRPFTEAELDLLETTGLALAPVIALKQGAEEGLFAHARRAWRTWLTRLTDSSHPGIKLSVAAAAVFLAALAFWQTDYRVSSRASVEGAIQRVTAAPFDGYIQSAPARAGDRVREGQLLASLEDEDLRLERTRWEAELELALRKEREAMAKGDRVDARLAGAQADQARARLDLALGQLSRADIRAPFDALVVKGDLSQQLGSPVHQGDVLFELAPLDAWRVILKVDERDIARIREGQLGELMLASLAGRSWPFEVKTVTPVAVNEGGRTYFRAEAGLTEPTPGLRPNMVGVAKVEAGQRSLLWIWTHRLVDWARLVWWHYGP